jgi:hypothetical protein
MVRDGVAMECISRRQTCGLVGELNQKALELLHILLYGLAKTPLMDRWITALILQGWSAGVKQEYRESDLLRNSLTCCSKKSRKRDSVVYWYSIQ